MGDDDYTVAGGKGLRLKGAKVKKNKKKKTEGSKAADKVTELDKALSADKRSDEDADAADGDDEQAPARQDEEYTPLRRKTETERRFEEAKRKKVRTKHTVRQPPAACPGWCAHLAFTPWSLCALMLTYRSAFETQLLEMAQSAAAKPELLKTHKERVEELNTYLSKLSEHHDMPKIGPG